MNMNVAIETHTGNCDGYTNLAGAKVFKLFRSGVFDRRGHLGADAPTLPSRKINMTTYKWQFVARFRYHAFLVGSRINRSSVLKKPCPKIKRVAKKEPELAAAGAVLFFGENSACH